MERCQCSPKTWEVRVPYGVVGCIVPWNYPLNLAITDAAPALMAGNTAVLKPDHLTTLTALWAVALLREAGLPADVLQVVTGDGRLVGPMLIDCADYIMFTGSTRTGKMVARPAVDRLIGCSLELGGKNPMIVLADADLEATVEGAIRGCFACAGQLCISIERIYVARVEIRRLCLRFRRPREIDENRHGPRLFHRDGVHDFPSPDRRRRGPRARRPGQGGEAPLRRAAGVRTSARCSMNPPF